MRYLLDTNVFYHLSNGNINRNDFLAKYQNDELLCCPINIIEIITGTKKPFHKRQKAMNELKKLIDSSMCTCLSSTNVALGEQLDEAFSVEVDDSQLELIENFIKATSEYSYTMKRTRESAIKKLRRDREKAYNEWKDDVLKIKRKKSSKTRELQEEKPYTDSCSEAIRNDYYNREILEPLTAKVRDVFHDKRYNPSAILPKNLIVYADIYYAYIVYLVSNRDKPKPRGNDFGDFEQLLYYGKYFDVFLTEDSKFLKRAEEAGHANSVQKPM